MSPFLAYIWFLLLPEIPAVLWTRNMPQTFNPRTFNYCNHPCNNPTDPSQPFQHVACNCETATQVAFFEEMARDLDMFRGLMLDMHNELRNRIASGAEPGCRDCPKAANMMRLSYDIELEYIAFCHIKQKNTMWNATHPHNYCRKKALQPFNSGKNLHYETTPYTEEIIDTEGFKKFTIATIRNWYEECKLFPNISKIIRRFRGGPSAALRDQDRQETYTHFTQFVWGPLTHIGCAVGIVRHPPYGIHQNWYYFECLYGGWKGGSNIMGEPVYLAGEPCTRCPFGTKCERAPGLEALCGPVSVGYDLTLSLMTMPKIRTKLTDYRVSPYLYHFPAMYVERKKKNITISSPNKPTTSTALPSIKNSLVSMFIMIFLVNIY